jgi:type II secretory pathway pseudopilin PulG
MAKIERAKFHSSCEGFSLVELVTAMTLTALILGVGVAAFSGAIGTRARQNGKVDALASAQAALNVMSRQIGNAGYGLVNNGLVTGANDCNSKRVHVRSNFQNRGSYATDSTGEDVTFYYDSTSKALVRFDRYGSGTTSAVVNQVADPDASPTYAVFTYYDYTYTYNSSTKNFDVTVTPATTCSANTARIGIQIKVNLANVQGQPSGETVWLRSDVTLRNSPNLLQRY